MTFHGKEIPTEVMAAIALINIAVNDILLSEQLTPDILDDLRQAQQPLDHFLVNT